MKVLNRNSKEVEEVKLYSKKKSFVFKFCTSTHWYTIVLKSKDDVQNLKKTITVKGITVTDTTKPPKEEITEVEIYKPEKFVTFSLSKNLTWGNCNCILCG